MGDYGERNEKAIKAAEDKLRDNAPVLLEALKEVVFLLSLAQVQGMELNDSGKLAVDTASEAIKKATIP